MLVRDANLNKRANGEKIILLFGARQVGKTTLLRNFAAQQATSYWLNADDPVVQALFENFSIAAFKTMIGNASCVIIDEAQQLPNIGLCLKLLYDAALGIQIVATGSSAFELRNKLNEQIGGKNLEYILYPFSFNELSRNSSIIAETTELPNRLVFGSYPEIITHVGDEMERLYQLKESYLFKEQLMWKGLKKSDKIVLLLRTLANQISTEVNCNELAKLLGLNRDTVEKYITTLEQSFVLFRVPSYHTNQRKELVKSKKIYFFDTGIRNALIGDYRPITSRQDVGPLFENYCIAELWKKYAYKEQKANFYFWRTTAQQEIDLIIETNGQLLAYEIKWNPKAKVKLNKTFSNTYPNHTFTVMHNSNYWQILLQ
jgi:uncharacterized protein